MSSFIQSALFVLICLKSFGSLTGNNWEPCPGSGWIQYNDEKCFKILDDTLRTFDDAKDACASQEPVSTLALIHSPEEQRFLSNYLFKTERKVDNFWIGAKFNPQNLTYAWEHDNSALNYTNWDTIPRIRTNYCAHMQADESVVGKWKDGPCEKKNAVLCQRMQFWSHELLKKTFLESRNEQKNALDTIRNLTQSLASANQRIEEQTQKWENVDQRIDELKQNFESANQRIENSLPIGFIYVQLPHQSEPKTLWPTMQWQDITPTYSGVFFRAGGGNSQEFGTVQEENAPRITEVAHEGNIPGATGGGHWDRTTLNVGGWSTGIGVFSGHWNGDPGTTHKFLMSGGEIRPRNMAVRIWKRES